MKKGLPPLSMDIESGLKLAVVAALFGWNFLEGAFFEHQYPIAMVSLYGVPVWRIAFLALVVLAADWCPSVALMLGFFIFFYIMDMEVTLNTWSQVDLARSKT